MSKAAQSVPCLTLLVNCPQESWFHYPSRRGPVDRFSKSCKFIPLKGLPTALGTAEHLFQHVFSHFGLPEEIANGQTERKIQELGRYLRSYCHEDQHGWSRFLPWAKYAQNSLCQDTTGLTPFQCILGYQPLLFPWTEEPSNVPAVDHWFRESERARERRTQHTIIYSGQFADTRASLMPGGGQHTYTNQGIKSGSPPTTCDCDRKLSPSYIGPFRILRQINDVTFQLQLTPMYRIHPTFHVSLLKPFSPSTTDTPGAEAEPPPPEVLDQPSIYMVHELLDSRRRGGHLEYLIDWEGYGPEEQSWVPRDDVLDPTLLLEFHRSHLDSPAPRSRGHPSALC
ncbi:Transposon Ty3-G Gag-Pol polyprotein [Labeo rohita]|uniref:Transposon Ty3-G Gag-Pol polyprotein n=1 Tax=Labeo rohita TaxID=84645 RepID=A0ABQ8L597_LABRO|nr:Transposon Ty3-G Gag-Pol polyprotein [Labeo rohita]